MAQRLWIGICVGLLALSAANLPAAPLLLEPGGDGYTLSEIMDAGGARVGDKVLADFRYTALGTSEATVPEANQIVVHGVLDGEEYGVTFAATWAVGSAGQLDARLGFSVTADDPFLVSDASLGIDDYAAENAQILVTEDVWATDPEQGPADLLGAMQAYYVVFGVSDANLSSHVDFTSLAQKQVWVVKDIALGSFDSSGSASLGLIQQTFSQVPEPLTLGLLSVGGLVLLRRRRRGLAVLLVAGLVAGMAAPARASDVLIIPSYLVADLSDSQDYTIQQINDAGGLLVGDKLFQNFSLASQKTGAAIVPGDDTLGITGIESGGNYGLQFGGNWSAFLGGEANSVLLYSVTVFENPGWAISDIDTWFSAVDASNGAEVVLHQDAAQDEVHSLLVGTNEIYYRNPADYEVYQHDDFPASAETEMLWVRTLIDLSSAGVGSVAGLSEFSQTYSQSYYVPEPATLLALSLAGLAALRRRSR